MAKSATIHVRVDEEVRNSAAEVVERLGLSLSSAISIYLNQIVIRQEIPFTLSTHTAPNARTIEALEEGEGIASGHIKAEQFETVDDLFRALS